MKSTNRTMKPGQSEVLLVQHGGGPGAWSVSIYGSADGSSYKFGSGNGTTLFADSNPTALTGAPTLTQGSASVTGSGTAFTTELEVGDTLMLADGRALATVGAIGSNTALTLTAVWAGVTGAAATYKCTLSTRTLGIGSGQSATFSVPPAEVGGTNRIRRSHLYIECVSGSISYDIDAVGSTITPIIDSLYVQLL